MDDSNARDAVMRQWVRQPPVAPNMQYLRDAEWAAARRLVGECEAVLDVASESRVTRSLNSERVTRVDFSPSANRRARDLLGDVVDQFETTTPSDPELPFPDAEFDAVVSIGPFDWKFLDVEAVTAEAHRVLDGNGRLVVSVPTPRSPYAVNGKNRFYTPSEAKSLLSPDWCLDGYDLIFQYPPPLHGFINRLPPPFQEPFVSVARHLSEQFTARDQWERASYLVVSAKPLEFEHHLDTALECLFRPTPANGFWDTDQGKLVRALRYRMVDGEPEWSPEDSNEWRYAPFALAGVLQWRDSALGHSRYDDQIHRVLEYFAERLDDGKTREEMPSYGLGPLIAAFAIAGTVFDRSAFRRVARDQYEYTKERFDFTHAEDSLLLYGWSYLYETAPDEDLLADIQDAMWIINERLTSDGLLVFDNGTTRRHQNQMYALWGLCRAITVTGARGYLDSVERVLEYTIRNRIRNDGGIVWEDCPLTTRLAGAVDKLLSGRPPYWEYLYECHQTFFVNAVAHYYGAGGEKDYDAIVGKVMTWIYGDNAHGIDLVDRAGNGIPMRHLTTDGRIDEPYFLYGERDQRYKGAYEVGSYIMALTHLLDGTVSK